MNSPDTDPPIQHPPGFRQRRGLNWAFLGLLYTSYYMCRYNFSIANSSISTEFGFSTGDMGWIITLNLLAYGLGQIVNGLITDKIGGRKAMLIGAAATIIMNILFGVASFWGLFGLFLGIWSVNGYVQSFGSPGMVKINAAWFERRERGRFAGIYGFMINLGRFGIFKLGPALLAGFSIFGMIAIGPLHWRWLFWAPSIICAFVAVCVYFIVKETPEEAGFFHMEEGKVVAEDGGPAENPRSQVWIVFIKMITNPAIWVTAGAYACTGAVRQAIDQWFPRYMQEVHLQNLDGSRFQWLGFLIPFVASAGSLMSGYISDLFFKSRRAPVAAALYVVETIIILSAAQFTSVNAAILFFVLISFTANSTHSLLGTAAAMDIGGRKMSGFSSGLIDSCQYFGGSLAGIVVGKLIDHAGWETFFYFMAPFGIIGCLLMILMGSGAVTTIERARPKHPRLIIGTLAAIGAFVIAISIFVGFQTYAYAQTHLADTLGRKLLAGLVSKSSQVKDKPPLIRVIAFNTYAISPDPASGPDRFKMTFNATLEFQQDSVWVGTTPAGWDFHALNEKDWTSAAPATVPGTGASTAPSPIPSTPSLTLHQKKGDHFQIAGSAHYVHSQGGWKLAGPIDAAN